jgi:hypothetical protein
MKTDIYEDEAKVSTGNRRQNFNQSSSSKPNISKEEMMKKVKAAGTPGPAHQALRAFEGNWKAEVKCWQNPDGPANVSQATSKAGWILGGRFLKEEFHGEMMGKPFTGHCLLGFDNTKQKFNSVWVDDVNTAIYTSEGNGENGNKVITLEGKSDCPVSGQKDVPMKQVFRVISPDKHVLEMFNNKEKTMEITYTRS